MALLFLLLIVAPLVELYVIIQVAQVIGGWETIAVLILESFIGAWLLRRQGLSVMVRISEALAAHRVPGRELVDGFLLLVAGALMLVPGFVGDAIGFLLLIPFTRAPVRALLLRRFERGAPGRLFTVAGAPGAARFVGSFRAGDVVDTTGRDDAAGPDRTELGP